MRLVKRANQEVKLGNLLVSQSNPQSGNRSVSYSANQTVSQSDRQSVSQSDNKSISQTVNQLKGRQTCSHEGLTFEKSALETID